MKKTLSIVLLFLANIAFSQEIPVVENQTFEYQDNIVAYDIPQKMQWWYDARFGMFIHFGSYSHYGHGEWEMFLN
ncbi:MAG: alpha-L-fucosidase, partial [Bacteroidales bacterium]|nr:alpha-L-fucosidase [Bacteroidales bacterium]